MVKGLRSKLSPKELYFGYCPHPVTVYIRGPSKDYIYIYYNYYPTVTEGGQYLSYIHPERGWGGTGRIPSRVFFIRDCTV